MHGESQKRKNALVHLPPQNEGFTSGHNMTISKQILTNLHSGLDRTDPARPVFTANGLGPDVLEFRNPCYWGL